MSAQLEYKKFSFIEAYIIRWKTRSLGADIDALILIVSVLAYMGCNDLGQQLERAREIIEERVRLNTMRHIIFDRVQVELARYMADEEMYIKARNKMFEEITHNIQLYGIVLDMLPGQANASKLQIVRSVIQKAYDEEFMLNGEAKRLLEAQEKTNASLKEATK